MKRKIIWPGMLILMIAALVCVDVTMLIIATTANVYEVVPTDPVEETEIERHDE